jgi:hypothetical protein
MGVYRFVGWFLFQYCLHATIVPHVVPLLATKLGTLFSINPEKDTFVFLIDTGDTVFNCFRKMKKGDQHSTSALKQIKRNFEGFCRTFAEITKHPQLGSKTFNVECQFINDGEFRSAKKAAVVKGGRGRFRNYDQLHSILREVVNEFNRSSGVKFSIVDPPEEADNQLAWIVSDIMTNRKNVEIIPVGCDSDYHALIPVCRYIVRWCSKIDEQVQIVDQWLYYKALGLWDDDKNPPRPLFHAVNVVLNALGHDKMFRTLRQNVPHDTHLTSLSF